MQATRTLGGPGISRSLGGVVVAIAAAFMLGAGGGYAARSVNVAAPASTHLTTVSVRHQLAPDAADRNAQLGVRKVGPGGQIGDLAAGNDPNALVSAPTRAVVPAIDPAAGYDISKYVDAARPSDDACIFTINQHKAC